MSFAISYQNKNREGDTKTPIPAKSSNHIINNSIRNSQDYNIHISEPEPIGNQAVQRLIHPNVKFDFAKIDIYPKLKVSQPGDAYEQEADRVAEQVMGMSSISDPIITSNMSPNHERIDRRKCSACEMKEEEEEKKNLNISRKPSTISNLETTTDEITNDISNIRSSEATSLDTNTRGFMESRFGYDFSKVRIHADERAAKSAYSVNALAYTVGNDIVFEEGQYKPNSLDGRKLLVHELTHVVQQKGSAGIQRQPKPGQGPMIPQLKAVIDDGPTPGKNGKVEFIIHWEISRNSDARRGGWVVQNLTETWNNLECDGKPARNDNPKNPKTISPMKFFEAWRVDPNSKTIGRGEPGKNQDYYEWNYDELEDNRPWAGNCIDGSVTIEGTARYHDGVPKDGLPKHMIKENPKTFGGLLTSSTTDPNLDGNISQPVTHNLKFHWKCCPCSPTKPTTCKTVVDSHVP